MAEIGKDTKENDIVEGESESELEKKDPRRQVGGDDKEGTERTEVIASE